MDLKTNYCEAILGENPEAKASLRNIPGLEQCSEKLLDWVYKYSKPVNLTPGETLIEEGLFDQWVYFIIEGELDVFIGDNKLGTIHDRIVGERCILGEPRGANLIVGSHGVMALGIEMSIVDQIFREINDYSKAHKNSDTIDQFTNERHILILELYSIVLNEAIARIVGLSRIEEKVLQAYKQEKLGTPSNIESPITKDEIKTINPVLPDGQISEIKDHFVNVNFLDFSRKAFREILDQFKHLSNQSTFRFKNWTHYFKPEENDRLNFQNLFTWLVKDAGFSNKIVIELVLTLFEEASKYMTAANKTVDMILSLFKNQIEREEIIKNIIETEKDVVHNRVNITNLRRLIFEPFEQKLADQSQSHNQSTTSKMDQTDIDALFG